MTDMKKLDVSSFLFVILAVWISVYLWVAEKMTAALFPAFLAVAGLVIMNTVGIHEVEEDVGNTLSSTNLTYVVGCLFIFLFTSIIVNYIPLEVKQLTLFDSLNFSILMAISEESFFRGGMTTVLYRFGPKFGKDIGENRTKRELLASVIGGGMFAGYHLGVYQDPNSLIYVWVAGIMLSYVFLKSKSLFPSTVAHIANNIISILGGAI